MEEKIIKLTFVESEIDDLYYTETYLDENGKRYDFTYGFKGIKTKDENGNWVPFEDEYEVC